ncbi:MAG: hypothetical protein J6S14_15435 [Clostridia bacterium]|nr:hypothetical protein [Clostridia bacterium]
MGMFVWNTFLVCLAIVIIVGTFGFLFLSAAFVYQWLEEETDIIDWLKEKWQNRKGGNKE